MIIVTGASRGIGNAIGQRLANNGYDVLGIARSKIDVGFEFIEADVSNFSELKLTSLFIH